MSEIKAMFEQAAGEAQSLPRRPDNDTLLRLYALYKQATSGDVSGKRPGMFDLTGQAKYEAWKKVQGMKPEQAMQAYIDLVERLKAG